MHPILKRIKKNFGTKLIIALIVANIFAYYSASTVIKKPDVEMSSNSDSEDLNLLQSGWQVMHWSYSLLDFFKDNS
jgi:hypothetical protein